jgi:uncharacterized protein YndB with AHSA1/START domain
LSGQREIEVRRRLPAPIGEVFSWWTEPERLGEWMSPVGIAQAEVDLRVGGAFRIVMKGGDTVIHHTGEYLEIERPTRLVFTWRSPFTGPDGSIVTVDFEPDGDNSTLLRVVHSRLPDSVADSHRGGWGTMLDRLASGMPSRAAEGS